MPALSARTNRVPLGPDPFALVARGTIGLRMPYPVRDPAVIREAIPPGRQPWNFRFVPRLLDRYLGPRTVPLTYLDSTASTKMIGPVAETEARMLDHYSNSHSVSHNGARISTYFLRTAHETILRFVHANPETHTAIFVGSGATAAVNRVARNLFLHSPASRRDTVVFSGMEHHANQLPWMKYAGKTIGVPVDSEWGVMPLRSLETVLRLHPGEVRLVAMTGVSNVTGIVQDIGEIARLAHRAGAELLVDAAQMMAHLPIDMEGIGIDYLVASGHKVYAPGSPGVLVMPKQGSPRDPDEMGGGIVESVAMDRYLLTDRLPDREEAGTPDLIGAVMLASALMVLEAIGIDRVRDHELCLTAKMLEGLKISEVAVYGDTNLQRTPRVGVVSFNIRGLHHAIVAQVLSDYFNIAVRNECFCAHPYVKALLEMTPAEIEEFERRVASGDHSNIPGMVRASLGIYNDLGDVERLLAAIRWIVANRRRLLEEYEVDREGVARRKDGWRVDPKAFNPLPRFT